MASELELIAWLTASGALGWIALDLPMPRLTRRAGRAGPAFDVGATSAPPKGAADAPRLTLDGDLVALVRGPLGVVHDLPLVLGPDTVVDLARAPHVLVAGASGSGKSVALHAMIQGLLACGSADLWLVDPKMVEAAPYRGAARVVYRDGAMALLEAAVAEMERRYDAMLTIGARKWEGRALVVIVDEYGDLVLGADRSTARECERLLVRIAQMGRAAAVHLVLATQRPSADVVTPLIRANVPARLALRCASAADSRIIRGDDAAYARLRDEPIGSGIWLPGDLLVRAPFVDPYKGDT
jgi:hypothetical protein